MTKNLVNSTKWSAIAVILQKITAPVINIILARILLPEVFGLVATFTLVTTFADIFTDGGFQKYLIQHEFKNELEKEQFTCVGFWTNLILSVVLWFVIFAFRDSVAELIGSKGYGIEIAVACLQIPMTSFSSIQIATYHRNFQFKDLVPIRLIVSLTPLAITVPLAIVLKNAWSIIIGNLAKELVTAILLTSKSTWKPRFYFNFRQLKAMLGSSLWMMADSLMVWITSYAGTFIVARHLDSYHLGIYKTGLTTVVPYIALIYAITSPVLFSALSRLQKDKKELDNVYINFLKISAYILFPLGTGIFAFKELATHILLGYNWDLAIPVIGCVALFEPIAVLVGQYNSNYFRAVGKPNIALVVQLIYGFIKIIVLLIFVNGSFSTLCLVSGCIALVYSLISAIFMITICHFNYCNAFKQWWPPIVSSFIMALFGILLKNTILDNDLLQMGGVFICGIIYLGILILIPDSRKDIIIVFSRIKNKFVR